MCRSTRVVEEGTTSSTRLKEEILYNILAGNASRSAEINYDHLSWSKRCRPRELPPFILERTQLDFVDDTPNEFSTILWFRRWKTRKSIRATQNQVALLHAQPQGSRYAVAADGDPHDGVAGGSKLQLRHSGGWLRDGFLSDPTSQTKARAHVRYSVPRFGPRQERSHRVERGGPRAEFRATLTSHLLDIGWAIYLWDPCLRLQRKSSGELGGTPADNMSLLTSAIESRFKLGKFEVNDTTLAGRIARKTDRTHVTLVKYILKELQPRSTLTGTTIGLGRRTDRGKVRGFSLGNLQVQLDRSRSSTRGRMRSQHVYIRRSADVESPNQNISEPQPRDPRSLEAWFFWP